MYNNDIQLISKLINKYQIHFESFSLLFLKNK